jgi:hypothetical protein
MSKLEIRIFMELKTLYSDVRSRAKIENREVDIFLPRDGIAVEIDGEHWHRGKEDKDKEKGTVVSQKVRLIRLREWPLLPISEYSISFLKREKHLAIIKRLIHLLMSMGASSSRASDYLLRSGFVNEGEYQEAISKRIPFDPDNTLEYKYPGIAVEWHPGKNGLLLPAGVSAKSGENVWWRCGLGHEWQAKISNRTANGTGCPVCWKIRRPEILKSISNNTPANHIRWHKRRGIFRSTCELCRRDVDRDGEIVER